MNATELEIAIVAVCALLLSIPLFKWLKKIFKGPNVTVEFRVSGSPRQTLESESVQWMNSNVETTTINKVGASTHSVRITVSNFSELTAYSTTLLVEKDFPGFKKLDVLDSIEPMRGREIRILDGEYNFSSATSAKSLPLALADIRLVVSYKNAFNIRFYTIYDHKRRSNKRVRLKPWGFRPNGKI